jgi:hypothetical protein
MKIKNIFLVVMVLMSVSIFAQTRDDIRVYIAPVVASPDQAKYFVDNFTMETAGAGYNITENVAEADYTLKLEVKPNMVLYDDGSLEQAPPDEKQSVLYITLLNNEENAEVVTFGYPFTELEEMNEFNLYLLYEAMANVPLTKFSGDYEPPELEPDHWRNKWIYLHAAFSYPIMSYKLKPEGLLGNAAIYNDDEPEVRYSQIDHKVRAVPGVTFGLEFQFLNWMSAELVFDMTFGDPMSYSFIPGIGAQLKFPIKPSDRFMLEPYLAVNSRLNTSDTYAQYPFFGAGGGFQFGEKGGSMGAFVIDANFIYSIGELITYNTNKNFPKPSQIHWDCWTVGLSIGYKVGFLNRNE